MRPTTDNLAKATAILKRESARRSWFATRITHAIFIIRRHDVSVAHDELYRMVQHFDTELLAAFSKHLTQVERKITEAYFREAK